MTPAIIIKIVVGALSAILLGWYANWKFYRSGKETQKGIDQNASFEKHKKAEEIAARPVNSVEDVIDRL
jgi:hypothetical protein